MELTWNGTVHPAAALFPMLSEEDLALLADDIGQNGLREAIKLDPEGTLIDGRNRQRACELAGIAPRYESLNGQDPVDYIVSANIRRRHLTQGQRVMAEVASQSCTRARLAYGQQRDVAARLHVDPARLSQALLVADLAPEYVEAIIAGSYRLADAYAEARQRKEAKESAAVRARQSADALAALRAEAPDLAALVDDNRLALHEAQATLRDRQVEDLRDREDMTQFFAKAVAELWAVVLDDPERIAARWVDGINKQRINGPTFDHLWTAGGLRSLAQALDRIAADVDRRGGLH